MQEHPAKHNESAKRISEDVLLRLLLPFSLTYIFLFFAYVISFRFAADDVDNDGADGNSDDCGDVAANEIEI